MVISLALLENAERCVNIGEIQLPFWEKLCFDLCDCIELIWLCY